MGNLIIVAVASGVFWLYPVKPAPFHMDASYHCLPGADYDSAVVCVAGWNDTDSPLDAYLAIDLSWYYEPSESLRRTRRAYADSVAKAAGGADPRKLDIDFL